MLLVVPHLQPVESSYELKSSLEIKDLKKRVQIRRLKMSLDSRIFVVMIVKNHQSIYIKAAEPFITFCLNDFSRK